ncbi:MAG: serine hydrolase domain-containing protein [Candidatus Aminicenantales bacterium]
MNTIHPPHRAVKTLVAMLLFVFIGASVAGTAVLPKAKPSEAGLSADRLARLGRVMQEYCDKGRTTGIVVLLMRNSKVVYNEAFGKLDPVQGTPMPLDAIFRIMSQTKALTSVAVMTLLEEGKLLLDDPVSLYLPEFASTRVAVKASEKDAAGYSTIPAKRPITIRDLLTHTSGLSYGEGPASKEYAEAGVRGFMADADITIAEVVRKIAALPFDAQPGERWVYGLNMDVLGALVERVSGMTLAEYFEKKITTPLGMKDTVFYLPEAKVGRLTPVYGVGPDGKLKLQETAADSPIVRGPRKCYMGGSGLVSTAEDYARFLQMLCNGGELGGVRILGPKSVELMTANHVGNLYNEGRKGFGLGFWVTERVGRSGLPDTPGAYGWGGALYSTYWVDPVEKLVAVFMTQLRPAGDIDLQEKLKVLVYQSITDSYER